MIGNTIKIDGVSSRVYGLFIKQLPMFPVALENVNYASVGKLETLYQHAENYNDIQVTIQAVLVGFEVDAVYQWISNGKKLWLSNQPEKCAKIKQIVSITQNRAGNGALEIEIAIQCSPFKYSVDNQARIYSVSPSTFQTQGTLYSEPTVKVNGATNGCTVTINGKTMTTNAITGDFYIDVKNRAIYREDGTILNSSTSGEIWNMLLVPSGTASNSISFTNCTSVEVQYNERWL